MKQTSTRSIILMALFATLTVIGTTIRIPMPAAIGAPFIHLGNAALLLAVLLLGYKKGALAGGLGFAIFDCLNGYAAEAPYFILESFIVGGVAALIFKALHKKEDHLSTILLVAFGAGLAKIGMTFSKNLVLALLMGTKMQAAVVLATTSLPATIVNSLSTLIIVTILYLPLKKIMNQTFH